LAFTFSFLIQPLGRAHFYLFFFSKSYVFNKQSDSYSFMLLFQVSFLLNLRRQFAEFLQDYSFFGLYLLNSFSCVSFSTVPFPSSFSCFLFFQEFLFDFSFLETVLFSFFFFSLFYFLLISAIFSLYFLLLIFAFSLVFSILILFLLHNVLLPLFLLSKF